jgi:hypothetical protein
MIVYLATSGEYSDYRVQHVFAKRGDAEAYALGDDVKELEVRDGPVEVRTWHMLMWHAERPDREADNLATANPAQFSSLKDFDGDPRNVTHAWYGPPERTGPVLHVEGWDLRRIRKVYSEQRAQFLARKASRDPRRGDERSRRDPEGWWQRSRCCPYCATPITRSS